MFRIRFNFLQLLTQATESGSRNLDEILFSPEAVFSKEFPPIGDHEKLSCSVYLNLNTSVNFSSWFFPFLKGYQPKRPGDNIYNCMRCLWLCLCLWRFWLDYVWEQLLSVSSMDPCLHVQSLDMRFVLSKQSTHVLSVDSERLLRHPSIGLQCSPVKGNTPVRWCRGLCIWIGSNLWNL